MSWDPYAALGLGRTATADDISSAYRRLAKELHPDVRPGDDRQAEQRFKRATAAFNLLTDPVTKGRFDRGEIDADGNERAAYGGRPRQSARGAYAGAGAGPGGPGDAFDLGDIFSDLFGPGFGGGRTYPRMRGRDVRYTVEIDFLDAVNGARQHVPLGEGRTLDVSIPAGVKSGQVLRLKGQGGPGVQGGPSGDALLQLDVRPHPYFRRDGHDIHVDIGVSLQEAIEGARIEVPTIAQPVVLNIPPGSNSGKLLRLKSKGVAGQGDQFVRLQIMVLEGDENLRHFVKKWPKRDWTPRRTGGG